MAFKHSWRKTTEPGKLVFNLRFTFSNLREALTTTQHLSKLFWCPCMPTLERLSSPLQVSHVTPPSLLAVTSFPFTEKTERSRLKFPVFPPATLQTCLPRHSGSPSPRHEGGRVPPPVATHGWLLDTKSHYLPQVLPPNGHAFLS